MTARSTSPESRSPEPACVQSPSARALVAATYALGVKGEALRAACEGVSATATLRVLTGDDKGARVAVLARELAALATALHAWKVP